MNQLSKILKTARRSLELTQDQVAKKLGITQRAYAFYEDGKRTPKPKRLGEIAKILDIPVNTLSQYYSSEIEQKSTEGQKKQVEPDLQANLTAIAKSLANLENGQHYIRAEVRGYGQYQIQQEVGWDQEKFLQAMAKVGMLVGANLKAGDLGGNNGATGRPHKG